MKSKNAIQVAAIQTSIFKQGQDLHSFLVEHLTSDELENNCLAITSKIVSLAENRVIAKSAVSKKDLILRECDHFLTEGLHGVDLTLTHGLLIPSAGIDESNSEGDDYLLYPKDPYASAAKIHQFLSSKLSIKNFGVILTDSHSMPLRRGVTGLALAHWGFQGCRSLVGSKDIFGKTLKFTHVNVADALATMAVFQMGEGAEGTPLALIRGAELVFTDTTSKDEVQIKPTDDIYYPLLKPWLSEKKPSL